MPTMAQNATPPPLSPIASATVTGDSSDAPSKLTPERKALESKLHPSLLEAFDCVAKKQQECKLVHDGKVEIQIWLTANSASVLDALRKAGFEPTAGQLAEKTLVGKIAVEKLQPLTLVSEVRFVSQGRK